MSFNMRYKSHHNVGGLLGRYYPSVRVEESKLLEKLSEKPKDVPRAVYVHTPYCDKICSFCNLNREQIDGSLDSYTDYIVEEFNKYGKYRYFKDKSVDVIYFGGGTPTVYNSIQLEKILKSVKENLIFSSEYEFTFETTLHNLNDEKIKLMNEYGVNRISIGIQSFSEIGRKFYNRTYNKSEVIKRVMDLKQKFRGEVCVDIIYNYPNQTMEQIKEDAKLIKKLDLGSSSFYSLMIHEGSKLSGDMEENKLQEKESLKRERELHDEFIKELTSEDDYYILELTKIAKKGRDKYKYIKTRSFGGDTFPIGVGAGGSIDNISIFRMKKDMSIYMEKSEYHQRIEKFSGLFQFPNIKKEIVKNILNEKEYEIFIKVMRELQEKNLMKEDEKNYLFTEDGIFWGNNISREILIEVIEKGR